MDINNIKTLVAELSRKLADGDKFFTGKLAARLTKAAEIYPGDPTIIQMAAFLNKRASVPGGYLISRAELKNLYDRLYVNNTKCSNILSEELNLYTDKDQVKRLAHSENEGILIDYNKHVDPIMAKELNAVFDKSAKYEPYSDSVAKQAEDACRRVLGPIPKIKTVDGRDFAILCNASYQTPKGTVEVLIPVDVINGQALLPTVFLSTAGFIDLNRENLTKHVVESAGKQFRVNASKIFEVIKVAKFGMQQETIDPVEHAVMMLKDKTRKAEASVQNALILQQIDAPSEAKKEESAETKSFAAQMNTVSGAAEFVFGKKALELAHNFILNDLLAFGYKNPVIKLASINEDVLNYVISIGGAGFKVPIKIKQGKVMPPSFLFANGNMEEFSSDGIKKALGLGDQRNSSIALGYSCDNPGQLIESVKNACLEKDYLKASEIISAISASGDKKALAYAFGIYTDALGGKMEVKAENKIPTIKVGGQEVCAQTYLPVDKVYMDENGVCHPKYRQNIEKTDNAAVFMHQKILMGL